MVVPPITRLRKGFISKETSTLPIVMKVKPGKLYRVFWGFFCLFSISTHMFSAKDGIASLTLNGDFYRLNYASLQIHMGFPGDSAVQTPPTYAGDTGSVRGSGRHPGEGDGNPSTPVYLSGKSQG